MACRSSRACNTTTTSASVTPAGACTTIVWLNCLDRAVHALQPAHDRGGHHRPDALVDHGGRTAGDPGDPGQPGDGLLDEDVARPAQHPGRPRPRHHLHRQDAVPAQIEERVVDPDPLQPEHLGVDVGQDLLDRGGRGAIRTTSLYSGAGRARVSSLPLTVNGNASSTTTAAGTM